jgi:uncharacterized protein (TIGR00369 family)
MTDLPSIEELNAFFRTAFTGKADRIPEISIFEPDRVVMRLQASNDMLRPGGYISGPTQMQLADHAAYVAVFTQLGIVPMAVTSNLNINFLRPCLGESVAASAKILKLGRTLAVIEVEIKGDASDKIASHAIVTYSIPADARVD